jgi:serine/threonine-protein kinase PknK
LAGLNARLLRIETLAATGRADEARAEQADVESHLAEIGLSRLLVDAGLR